MKKTIQKITKLVALSAYLVAYGPAFAAPQANETEQGGFFDVSEALPWHIGVKLWSKGPIKKIKNRFCLGHEFVIGPFVEWKPLNGIGIQTGVMYSYNRLGTLGADIWGGNLVDGWSGKATPIKDASNGSVIDVDAIKFQAISIPLSIRFYPGSDRQFVLHIGPRLMIPFKAKQTYYDNIRFSDSESDIKNKLKKILESLDSDNQTPNELKIGTHLTWDWGFSYNTKSGFIIGMNGIGLMLGFDGTKLLSN
ncbi:outer membrane beta-barrel protein [Cardinium endosymbiont of Bemisia tabaci]|uniref:outer membrane beta-barrel protein n=1 Tax=Cardinium endosymbiont of Bemisia tabaci TaxID=672794 RepID=UPI000442D338|nr:outer membrane beta-barrel protein [Cardinium endosymbiont of Bemisia tabaci]CDG49903.1 Putative beta-barrel outer membrane protein [Cardinium endosymbiont cBtQ1 of Bemisia tabaci]